MTNLLATQSSTNNPENHLTKVASLIPSHDIFKGLGQEMFLYKGTRYNSLQTIFLLATKGA